MKSNFIFALALAAANTLSAQTFSDASSAAQARNEKAAQEYAAFMESITEEKAELGAKLDLLEEELRSKQNEFSTASRVNQTINVEVSQLDQRIASLNDTNSYIKSTLINEYIRRLELSLDPAETQTYGAAIKSSLQVLDAEEGVDVSDKQIFTTQLKVIELSLSRIEGLIGGALLEGKANIDGDIVDGKFALMGPHTFFSGSNGLSGIVNGVRPNTQYANVYPLPESTNAINQLTSGDQSFSPIDPTGNSRSGSMTALKSRDEDLTLIEEFEAGGTTMFFIIGLFAVAILITIFKTFELFSVKRAKSSDLDIVLDNIRQGNKDAALSHAKSIGGPAGNMMVMAVQNADEEKEVIEEVLYEAIVTTQPKLDRFLAFIAVTAATAPLFGLLGTVTGMIKTFKLITVVGTGDANSLSSGISEALITTKWGLIVAIPTLIFHALLNRKAKGVIGSMEQTAVGFINGIVEIRESK